MIDKMLNWAGCVGARLFINSYGDCIGNGVLAWLEGFGLEGFWNRKLVIWVYHFNVLNDVLKLPGVAHIAKNWIWAKFSCAPLWGVYPRVENCKVTWSRYTELWKCGSSFLTIFIVPFLHLGQQVMSLPVNRSIISSIVSWIIWGSVASGSINFLNNGIAWVLFLWARNPK